MADQITIDDAVIITGNTTTGGNSITKGFVYEYSPVAVAQNTNAVLSYPQLINGIITGLTIAHGIIYTLPTGLTMGSSVVVLGNGTASQYNQSVQRSILNMSSTDGNITIVQSTGPIYVGDTQLTINASYRFLTIYRSLNNCVTYRICNSSNI